MPIYISILRGINISGHNPVKMDALKQSYQKIGLQNITTYVQSGNVIFTAEAIDAHSLEQNISRQIELDFGYKIPVIVLTNKKLKQIIDGNPFLNDTVKDSAFLYVTFLSFTPEKINIDAIEEKKQRDEEIVITGDVAYLYCPGGYGKTKLSNSFLEKKLNVVATTRNWKTTNELLKIASKLEL